MIALLVGHDALAALPTGFGKSLIYQVRAMIRKRRLDDIGFPIDAGGFTARAANIICNKDCNICCKALRRFWREVCG